MVKHFAIQSNSRSSYILLGHIGLEISHELVRVAERWSSPAAAATSEGLPLAGIAPAQNNDSRYDLSLHQSIPSLLQVARL